MQNEERTYLPGVATLLALACLSHGSMALAQGAGESKLKVTGFLSVIGGQVIDGKLDADYLANGADPINGVACPCYIADWSNAGVYNKDFSLTPETRAGVQLNYAITDKVNAVAQIVVRGTNGTPDLTWAYVGYKFGKNWEVQVGRKRIPLYYYSDFQDIGVAYPWVSPPPELYGWDATNYNGGSMRYSASFAETNLAASVFAGREDIDKSLYWKLYGSDNTRVAWKNIAGADLEVARGPLTVRGVYMSADVETNGSQAALKAYGLSANLDFDNWFVLSEVTKLTRDSAVPGQTYTAPAATIGAGVRMGKWTPFINYAQYVESSNDPDWVLTAYKRASVVVRYDVDSSSAVKVQLDKHQDATNNFGGGLTLLRISYDRVF